MESPKESKGRPRERLLHCAFVSGAAGFVGSHIAQQLLAAGVHVKALVRSDPPPGSLLASLVPELELIQGDLLSPQTWTRDLRGCDTVFHVAAMYSPKPAEASLMLAVNVGGTQAILQASADAGVKRFVHTSTAGTIGHPLDGSLPNESTPFNLWRTCSEYVRSKWLGESAALWWNRRALPVIVVHPTAPVGAGDWKPTATGQRFCDVLAGRRPDYPKGGMNFCPVHDVAAGHILAAQRGQPGQRYILGHRSGNLSEEAFLNLLAEVNGLTVPPRGNQPDGGKRPLSLIVDPTRAIRELGMPQSNLAAAFRSALAFFQGQPTQLPEAQPGP